MVSEARREPLDLYLLRPTLGQGGADRVTLTLLEALDRRRFRPTLVLLRRGGALVGAVPADIELLDLGGRSLWTAWWPLLRLLRRRPPDVLFSTSSGSNVIACLVRRLGARGFLLVLSERNMLLRDQPPLKRGLMLLAKRWLYPAADRITAVSRGVRADLERRLRLAPGSVRVVPNPVVTPDLAALAAEPLDHPAFDGAGPVLLAAGRLVPAKGFDLLLDAFARLDPRYGAHLVILGEGPLAGYLARRARDHRVEERVHLAGFDPNPFRYMARCTLFVLSSRFEGLPGVLIQAMACGAPVIATDCPSGPSDIVTDGEDGLLVPVGDLDALVEKIAYLLDHAEVRTEFARRARGSVRPYRQETALAAYESALLDPIDAMPRRIV